MAKFFRKFRIESLRKSRFGNYLKYASGEILLIVIGILIAVQIDKWNTRRENRSELMNSLKELNVELSMMQSNGNDLIHTVLPRIKVVVDSLQHPNVSSPTKARNFMIVLYHPEFSIKNSNYAQVLEKLVKGSHEVEGMSTFLSSFYSGSCNSITEKYNELKIFSTNILNDWSTEPWYRYRNAPDSMLRYETEFLDHYSYRNKLSLYSDALEKYRQALVRGMRELSTAKVYLEQVVSDATPEDYQTIYSKNRFNTWKLSPCSETSAQPRKSVDGLYWTHVFVCNKTGKEIRVLELHHPSHGSEKKEFSLNSNKAQGLFFSPLGSVLRFTYPDGTCEEVEVAESMGSVILE